MNKKHSILVLDDDPQNNISLYGYFRRDFNVHCFTQINLALDFIKKNSVNIIITDQKMPEMNGLEFLKLCKVIQPKAFRFLISGHVEPEKVKLAIFEKVIHHFFYKPYSMNELYKTIELIIKTNE